jgi:hypothetical protein
MFGIKYYIFAKNYIFLSIFPAKIIPKS